MSYKDGKFERAVVVTTKSKGVFFGYTNDPNGTEITLHEMRMAVQFKAAHRGVVGLAGVGPTPDCKISFAALTGWVNEITAIMDCKPEAVIAWEAAPW